MWYFTIVFHFCLILLHIETMTGINSMNYFLYEFLFTDQEYIFTNSEI